MRGTTSRGLLIFLAIFALFVGKTKTNIVVLPDVHSYNTTTTSRADYYVIQNQRQFTANTKILDNQLIEFKKNFFNRVEALGHNVELLETKLNDLENKLNPLEILDAINEHCVEKYRPRLPTQAIVKANLSACLTKANAAYAPIVSSAETTLKNLKNHYTNPFGVVLKDCKKKFPQAEDVKYTECVTAAVKTTTLFTTSSTTTFLNQMKYASCVSNLRIKESFDCYSAVVFTTFSAIGEVTALVENCLAGREFCSACGNEAGVVTQGRCPYHMSWHLSDEDLTSEKIANPFKGGIGKTTPCLQINFITKSPVPV